MTGGPATGGLTAMAMAAGRGTRMRPLTDDCPKPLIRVAGKPLIDHALDRLAECGATRIVVNVHHFAEMTEAHLRTRTSPPDILISDERAQLLETGGGLVKARSLLGDAPILVTNTDPIFAPDGESLWPEPISGFDPEREDARLLLVPKHRTMGLDGPGDFHLEPDGRLRRREPGAEAPYFYTGMQILNPAVLAGWAEEPFSTNRIWDRALAAGRLTGAVFAGEWLHVGDPIALRDAEARLALPAG